MKTLQAIGDFIVICVCLLNIGIWMWNGCRLPRYVHWIALVAFFLGAVTSYQIFTLGSSLISTLWVPFLFAGIVYAVFILHGAGVPEDKVKKPKRRDKPSR